MLPLDCRLEFDREREEEFFAALPARPAIFLVEPRQAAAHPYLVRTADLRRRVERLLRAPEGLTKRLHLWEMAARVRYRLTGSTFEQILVLYQHARELFPQRYRSLVRLRPPALLKVSLSNEYPRCYVTRRILSDGGFYLGPFPSRRAAEAFADKFLDLFKIRRDPSFPDRMYSEMKMCLAPCFAGCSKEEYDVEVGRVVSFLTSSGAALAGEFERERAAASEALDFECAAALHRKLEKVAEVLRGLPELARKLDELDAVIVQCAAEESAVAIFAVRGGRIADPFFLRFGELASQPRSVEEILRESLTAVDLKGGQQGPLVHEAHDREGLVEHLALLARWFYSKPREGEIFFRQGDWPYRRIIRACSRLLAPPASPPPAPDPQRGADSA